MAAQFEDLVPLLGSERQPLESLLLGALAVGPANPSERFEVTVALRRDPNSPATVQQLVDEISAQRLSQRSYLSREEFGASYGASRDDIAQVVAFAQRNGLAVLHASRAQRTIELSGTVAAMSAAFNVELMQYEHAFGTFRERTGPLYVPAELAAVILGVFGLDDRPQLRSGIIDLGELGSAARPFTAGTAFTAPQLAKLYDFPNSMSGAGAGECIAILEFGGGYRMSDLRAYFARLGITPLPQVTAVSVDRGKNRPTGNPNGPDGEVMLDIEVAGAVAPGARLVVYFAPNTSKGFVDAVKAAIHDTVHRPSVVSISWGGPEVTWTGQIMHVMDRSFQDAAAMGISVFVAAGDNGSSDGLRRGVHVDFPASSPHVTGCGGTQLEAAGGAIASEVVWNAPGHGATGGGVSAVFPKPSWQSGANVPAPPPAGPGGRGVPDVAADASPLTGYQVLVDGHNAVFGGTSAVAPLWSGLTALMNQRLRTPVGYINPKLYGLRPAAGAFHDITVGNNGVYKAGAGWDPCTGLGSPDGSKLLQALGS